MDDPTNSQHQPSAEAGQQDTTGADPSALSDALAAIADGSEPGTVTTAEEPSSEAVDPAEDLGAGFRLADVPEENGVREHVERYTKQLHGAFTKKTQELATQRSEVESLADLNSRLGSDDPTVRNAALEEFLSKHDLEFEPANEEEAAAAATAAETATDTELAQRVEALEAERAAEAQATADAERPEYIDDVRSHIDDGLSQWAKGRNFDGGSVPDEIRDYIVSRLAAHAPVDGLWPDMDKAIADYEAWETKVGQVYVSTKRVEAPDASGSSGVPRFDATSESDRQKAALAIAGRHLG
jgi:hypothetical protein